MIYIIKRKYLTCPSIVGLFIASIALSSSMGISMSEGAGISSPKLAVGKLLWSDEFQGKASREPNPLFWTGNIGSYNYDAVTTHSPDLSLLDGSKQGILNIKTVKINDPSLYSGLCGGGKYCQFKSGEITTRNLLIFKYGYIEARIKMPTGEGNWSAFWMLPDGNYVPNNQKPGEIDIVEWYAHYPNKSWSTLHFEAAGASASPSAQPSPAPCALASASITPNAISQSSTSIGTNGVSASRLSDGFHTYGIAWLPDSITFYLDGNALATYSATQITTWPFNNFFYLILNGGVGPQPNTIFGGTWDGWQQSTMSVDWVRDWQLNGYGQISKKTIPAMTPAQMLAQLK